MKTHRIITILAVCMAALTWGACGAPESDEDPVGEAVQAVGVGGACKIAAGPYHCDTTLTCCDMVGIWGTCFDTMNDPTHCAPVGFCGVACTGGKTCQSGSCACPAGQSDCSGTCVNEQTDEGNCSACGVICRGLTPYCHAGTCSQCDVDANCPVGKVCLSGTCGCAAGKSDCSGTCVNTQSDESNCGGCGTTCTAGQACGGGVCGPPCSYHHDCASGKVCIGGFLGADQIGYTGEGPGSCQTKSCTTDAQCQALDATGVIAGWGATGPNDNIMKCFSSTCYATASDPAKCGSGGTPICNSPYFDATCLTWNMVSHGCDGNGQLCTTWHSKSLPGYWRDCVP